MELVIDLGNSLQKVAIFDHDQMVRMEQFQNISLPLIQKFVEKNRGIQSCILSSVIPHPSDLIQWLKANFHFIELTDTTPVPLNNRYRTPETLGKDRLAAAVAGVNLFPGSDVLIIIAGTCVTYNLVTAGKEFLGGAISPGMQMRFRAMHTFTGNLPLLTFPAEGTPVDPLGRDTNTSMIAGVIRGMISEMEGFAGLYGEKYPGLKIIFSGGDLNYFNKLLKISIFAYPNIVLQGLHQILAFNVSNG